MVLSSGGHAGGGHPHQHLTLRGDRLVQFDQLQVVIATKGFCSHRTHHRVPLFIEAEGAVS